jgi:nitrogen-specific signal transduction histidine kinase
MSTQVTITLTDDVYQKADRFARLANRDLASVLADTIQSSIPNISAAATILEPVSLLADSDVLALTELQMEPSEDNRLSELLDRQQAGILTEIDRSELQLLMQTYQEGLLRKATALSEAVKRKLIKPLSE